MELLLPEFTKVEMSAGWKRHFLWPRSKVQSQTVEAHLVQVCVVPARSQQCFLMFYLFWSLLQHFGIVIQETFLIMVHFFYHFKFFIFHILK